jgi:hypothetical protein
VKKIRRRLTYANVMSSIAVFLVLGGAAFAAAKLPKNSVGTKQLKHNAVTTAKLKKNAVTTAKIKNGAVNGAKIADAAVTGAKVLDGSLTGADINAGSLGTVPNSATTNVIKTGHGIIHAGQEATVYSQGPLSVIVKCGNPEAEPEVLSAQAYIASSSDNSTFVSWNDGSTKLGPGTPADERELNQYYWVDSNGPFEYDSASDVGVSATAANGESFTAFVGLAAEKETGTCWYWMNATIL